MSNAPSDHPNSPTWIHADGGECDWEETDTYFADQLARRVYGEDWAIPVSKLTGINVRTCQRVHAAAKELNHNRSSTGLLRALREKLVSALVESDDREMHTFSGDGYADLFDQNHPDYPLNQDGENSRVLTNKEIATIGCTARNFEAVVQDTYPVLMRAIQNVLLSNPDDSEWLPAAFDLLERVCDMSGAVAATTADGKLYNLAMPHGAVFSYKPPLDEEARNKVLIPIAVTKKVYKTLESLGVLELSKIKPFKVAGLFFKHFERHDLDNYWILMIEQRDMQKIEGLKYTHDADFAQLIYV